MNLSLNLSSQPEQCRTFHNVLVTPEQAREWLKVNRCNRHMSEVWVIKLMCDMLEGRWKYIGDSIRFGSDGSLLDGQHRLKACAEAGIPFETNVVYGLDPACWGLIDINKIRTTADSLSRGGVPNSHRVAAAAALIIIYKKRGWRAVGDPRLVPTKPECELFVKEHPDVVECCRHSNDRIRKLGVLGRVVDSCRYVFGSIDAQSADSFFSQMSTGADLGIGSPVLALRKRLLNQGKYKIGIKEQLALHVKTFNLFRSGSNSTKVLIWKQDEGFPEIVR